MFEIFCLEAYSWTDALDFFGLPHYTNENSPSLGEISHFKFVEIANQGEREIVVVLWKDRPEPTQAECQQLWDEEESE